jgi:hypothetical protein
MSDEISKALNDIGLCTRRCKNKSPPWVFTYLIVITFLMIDDGRTEIPGKGLF